MPLTHWFHEGLVQCAPRLEAMRGAYGRGAAGAREPSTWREAAEANQEKSEPSELGKGHIGPTQMGDVAHSDQRVEVISSF